VLTTLTYLFTLDYYANDRPYISTDVVVDNNVDAASGRRLKTPVVSKPW
jgi:hypothetical protein